MKLFKFILGGALLFCLTQCYSQQSSFSNVLVLYAQNYTEDTQYQILNLNQTLYTEIKSVNGNEPSCTKLRDKISAYYEDYYVFHFEAKPKNNSNFYEVKVGNEVKLIKKSNSVKLYSIEEYILKYYCIASKNNPLRAHPNETANPLKINYQETSFYCVEIRGDWVKVKCNFDCEGCPNKKRIVGWIRWRKNGKKILKQHYVC